eukprot:GILK01012816.1.p1 GENE.GILK01012816.1~~GILK01012816.1.p1  ORF type:complete len:153 (+),score=23.43 GILK01012816.1:36-494(+)
MAKVSGDDDVDAVTVVQEAVDRLAHILFVSVGSLQRDALPVPLQGEKEHSARILKTRSEGQVRDPKAFAEMLETLAKDLVDTSRSIDEAIDQLPHMDKTKDQQLEMIAELEKENVTSAEELNAKVEVAAELLSQVRETLQTVAKTKLNITSR